MNARRTIFTILSMLIVFTMIFGSAVAEDGQLFRRNVSKTPEFQTDQAAIYMMDFYVPAQSSTGIVGPVINYDLADGTDAVDYPDRDYAKPLVTVFDDGPSEHQFISEDASAIAIDGGVIFGAFDAFVGVSLDDGNTWKTTNVSRSADLSSFTLADGEAYPGHVHKVVHQVFGDQIFVAWISKYCEGGSPLYSLDLAENAAYFADLENDEIYAKDAVYLYDLFGVGGAQGSVDYTEQGWPEVGEIPYSCVWTARGKLLPGDDPKTDDIEATHVIWTKAERLTSGVRDANLPAVDCGIGAGCIMTWQEDPEGLRPGTGLGPGEGWSGAVANGQTDIWFSFISDADFDDVFVDEDVVGAIELEDYEALGIDDTMPKPYVPMAMPTRLTDNAMCKFNGTSDAYCYIDFETFELDITTAAAFLATETFTPTADSDNCAEKIDWTTPGGSVLGICVTDDGRVLNGRLAATRVRLNLKPYTPADATDIDLDGDVDRSAWVIMAAEETKALGDMLVLPNGDLSLEPIDIGKDVWYYSFDMFAHPTIDQGGMLNQPAICSPYIIAPDGSTYDCVDNEFFPVQIDALNGGEFYLTEIARRFALTTNSVAAADASESGLSAMLIFKQGIINQGGPADIMLRRVVVPVDFDPAVDNPYAFENMACDEWVYTDGLNPNYLQGLCLSSAINISGTTALECTGATGNDACAAKFPVADDGSIPTDIESFPKLLEWRQLPYETNSETANTDDATGTDLDDQSWDNPYDIAKGHRGFLDGDYVMMMYAWSPNWKANTVGNDHYNLYVRRSFDGGLTWTTTPAEYEGAGLTAIENYCVATSAEECVGTEFVYSAGAAEQGRNVSQLIGNKITILDPRYSPTGGMKLYPTIRTDWLELNADLINFTSDDVLPYVDDEVRDPSKFFMIYETGDNTTSEFGEATPLDLFYSRATVYGDVWELDPDWLTVDETTGEVISIDDYRWNWDEHDQEMLSGEAGMLANPGGTFMYAVWNQWEEEIIIDEYGNEHENLFNSDMPFRRHMYLPDDTLETTAPVAEILAAPTAALATDQLTFVASGFDADDLDGENNIVAYDWYSSIDGFLGSGQILDKVGDQLSIGRHIITLVVTDDEGATGSTTSILVVMGGAFHTSMPMMRK